MKTTIHPILKRLRDFDPVARDPVARDPVERWRRFEPADYPALIGLLDVAADLPRLESHRALQESAGAAGLSGGLWPELDAVISDLVALQALVDYPPPPETLPDEVRRTAPCRRLDELDEAARELTREHCTHIDFFLDKRQQDRLDELVEELAGKTTQSWGQLRREAAPGLFELVEEGLRSEPFRRLCGFDLDRDEYTLTLSLQDLDRCGIGWHRDLYWPREWVGEDVFGVLIGLTSDTPEGGGAFLHWVEEDSTIRAFYRQRHQATVIWNGPTTAARPFHAVSSYLTEHRARHHLHLQCLRRTP